MLLTENRIICALDTSDIRVAQRLVVDLYDDIQIFKVGLEYFMNQTDMGLNAIGSITLHNPKPTAELPGTYRLTPKLFFDLKFHDIPKTVHGAISSIHAFRSRGQNIIMTTVHADGGIEMMTEAVDAADKKFEIIAVTLLTSIASKSATKIVLKRTEDALKAGVAGIVCSPKEVKKVRLAFGYDFKIIVPGIRPNSTKKNDHKRVGAPNKAMSDGATYLVVGRPITKAADPKAAAKELINSFND